MADTTPVLGLRRPAGADNVSVTLDIADNMTLIDTAVAARATTAALTAHEADTTAIHGIADTSALALNTHEHTTVTANRQTASYTLVLTDAGKVVEMEVAGANTLTVPPNSSVAFPVGTVIEGLQYGAGQTTVTPEAGVTLRSSGGKLKTSAQYAAISLRKIAADEWAVAGELSV